MFVFCFFNCIKAHSEFDVDYSDLIYEELTFDQYEKVGAGKSGHAYKIYFREYKEAFRVDAITRKKLDEEALDDLAQNVRVEVYFCATSSKQCEYKICEMRCDGVVLLTLDDYIAVNQNNQVIGMIVCPILALCGFFLVGLCVYALKRID